MDSQLTETEHSSGEQEKMMKQRYSYSKQMKHGRKDDIITPRWKEGQMKKVRELVSTRQESLLAHERAGCLIHIFTYHSIYITCNSIH
jgi:hypothetical protein